MPPKGVLIASAVAGLFLSGAACKKKSPPAQGTTTAMVKCEGINSCKGKSACHGAKAGHACAGKNACKGKGWVQATADDCKKKGGTILANK